MIECPVNWPCFDPVPLQDCRSLLPASSYGSLLSAAYATTAQATPNASRIVSILPEVLANANHLWDITLDTGSSVSWACVCSWLMNNIAGWIDGVSCCALD
jgi:hypothetical protein